MKYIYFSYKTVHTHNTVYKMIMIIHVPRNQSGAVPILSLLSVGSWGSGKLEGWDNWVKGGANRVSLQAT
jgi:hypothetical protein